MNGPRVIVALDFSDAKDALAFAARVQPADCRLKVGLELFTSAGPKVVTDLVSRGFDVFLDLKFHDIPNTVATACSAAARLGVWMLNVHTLGGMRMLKEARAAIDSESHRPLLIGVTILTSHADDELSEIGLSDDAVVHTQRLADMAAMARFDGVVCASTEASYMRKHFGAGFKLVTPGIRPSALGPAPSPSFPLPKGEGREPSALRATSFTLAADDQRRTMTPIEAVRAGADYLVIGRPITRAADPLAMLGAIRNEIATHG